ncbi:MAG: hypothetical protein HY315_06035, partial [Acidobacteria bacterium]|nr:hypothetical protein [Acidobacteriota bacterium]
FEIAREWYFERLREPYPLRPNAPLPAGDYNFADNLLDFASDRSRRMSANIRYTPGTYYDGRKKSIQGGIRVQAPEHLAADFTYSYERVKLKRNSFTASVTGLKVSYAFNTRSYLDVLLQYNSERKQLSSNIRFRLIHRPLSDLILVFNQEKDVGASRVSNNNFIVKYTYLFDF